MAMSPSLLTSWCQWSPMIGSLIYEALNSGFGSSLDIGYRYFLFMLLLIHHIHSSLCPSIYLLHACLIRTDATLDLSQNSEKAIRVFFTYHNLQMPMIYFDL